MTIDVTTGSSSDPNWWRQALVYQIYPRSFADANGDGTGDLKGITERAPYLSQLGIDAVWLSPFYPSALKDGGYDVADYRDVDPKIGTLDDFDAMAAAFKSFGIKVIVDIVPNHSSDDHVWFQEALKAPKGSPARARYIFRDGLGPNKDQPPSDWECMFGGSAWEPVGDGQYYLHLFDASQPDFNWSNPEVREDFLKTLRFWADRGVSGFRVDVAHGLAKDLGETLPSQAELSKLWKESLENGSAPDLHPFWDRSEVHDIWREWRKVFDEYDPPLTAVAEAWVAPHRKHLYASPEGLGQSFSFDLLMCDFNSEQFRTTITDSLEFVKRSGSSSTWVFSNHDVVRHATRYGLPDLAGDYNHFIEKCRQYLINKGQNPSADLELGLRRAKAATLMMLALPGSAYIYQGEELGLFEVADMPDEDRADPTYFRKPGVDVGRDGCRICLPWKHDAPNMGFGAGRRAHLPSPASYAPLAVDVQELDSSSTLNFYRRALALRHELQSSEELEWLSNDPKLIHFKRPNGWEVLVNFGAEPVKVPSGKIALASGPLKGETVPIDTAVWVVPQ